jgi:cell division protein FtsA
MSYLKRFKIDGQSEIKEPIGMYGGRLEASFHVVVGQQLPLEMLGVAFFRYYWLSGAYTLEPLASADAVLKSERKEAGFAFGDIGVEPLIYARWNYSSYRCHPFWRCCTDDIKEGCSIIEKQAELLKVKFGSSGLETTVTMKLFIPGLRREPKDLIKNLSKILTHV